MRLERGSVDVVSPASSGFERTETEEQACRSSDWILRAFAEAVAWDDGKLKRLGRVDMRRHFLEAFAKKLTKEDVGVVEATGNAVSVAAVITPHVKWEFQPIRLSEHGLSCGGAKLVGIAQPPPRRLQETLS
jgi:hypothetical protein